MKFYVMPKFIFFQFTSFYGTPSDFFQFSNRFAVVLVVIFRSGNNHSRSSLLDFCSCC